MIAKIENKICADLFVRVFSVVLVCFLFLDIFPVILCSLAK